MKELLALLQAAGWLAGAIWLGAAVLACARRAGALRRSAGFVPASLLGGAALLAAGPAGGDILPISQAVWALVRSLPAVLIIPIIAAAGLGANARALGKCSLSFTAILLAVSALQLAIGALFAATFGAQIYPTFGLELAAGFVGGHSTAGLVSRALAELGAPWWADAQSVAAGTATVGLGGGILLGLGFICAAQKRGWLGATGGAETGDGAGAGGEVSAANDGAEKSSDRLFATAQNATGGAETGDGAGAAGGTGVAETGDKTAVSSPANTDSFTGAELGRALCTLLLISAVALAAHAAAAPFFRGFGTWTYALFIALGLSLAAPRAAAAAAPAAPRRALVAILSDFAIAAAVASMDLRLLAEHFAAFCALCAAGFVATALFLAAAFAVCLPSRWFLRFIAAWGSSTGVFLTGILLLRAADPAGRSGVLGEYSIAFSLSGLVFYAVLQPVFALAAGGQALKAAVFMLALFAASALLAVLLRHKR